MVADGRGGDVNGACAHPAVRYREVGGARSIQKTCVVNRSTDSLIIFSHLIFEASYHGFPKSCCD